VRADNQIGANGAASLAPSLLIMTQLTSLHLSGTLLAIGGSWRRERALANAGNALMMLRAVGWGGCARGCCRWWGLRGASRGAAVRAGNRIGDDGAASLAPSLGRMTQLTKLNLSGTLLAIGGSWRRERVLASAGNALMMMRAVGWGGCARGCCRWWGLRAASRGAEVRAGNDIGADGAASLAPSLGRMAQLTSLDLSSTLRASAGLVL
jgi:hypothetical protein